MKKILCILVVVTGGMAVYAKDVKEEKINEVGRLGIGYQATMVDRFFPINQIAIRYAPKPFGGALIIGQASADAKDNSWGSNTHELVQLKGFYSLISREHSNFYVGGSLGLDFYDSHGNDTISWGFGGLTGVEWYFSDLPEIGFNFELGYMFDFEDREGRDTYFNGTYVSLGATYYF